LFRYRTGSVLMIRPIDEALLHTTLLYRL